MSAIEKFSPASHFLLSSKYSIYLICESKLFCPAFNLFVFILIVLSVIFGTLEDSNTYKNRECYDRSVYKCMNCNQKSCKYHVIADKIDKLDRSR